MGAGENAGACYIRAGIAVNTGRPAREAAVTRAPTVFISCGEASGDLYASELVRELKRRTPSLLAFGLAGDRSRAAGAELIVELDEVSVIGLVEVVSKLHALSSAMSRLVATVEARKPDVAVLIDFSGFNLRLARALKSLDVPVVYYVSPQLWAWRRGRIRAIRRCVDEMLVILPFEEAFYAREGVRARYVGHPLVDLVDSAGVSEEWAREHGIEPDRPLITILPGSRRREIELHLPVLGEAVRRLRRARPELQFLVSRAPTVPAELVAELLGELAVDVPILDGDVHAGLAHAVCAVVASGTATVEAALLGTPMVVVYRVGRMSYALGRRFVRVPHFSMVNLIAERALVPELIQDGMTPEAIEEHVLQLLEPGAADAQRQGLAEVKTKLGGGGASARAADAVSEYFGLS